ncbi:head-tail adaptor protein [Amylibacter sp. SFDW26]|uniref:head-tail adaptor protein n=1 Tax=Amylibacter sp. SFDW26 TaxID=2652722 RepID=UPI0012623A37|nr:head-tail adaptor protein [Amylibacter sp. SFDW26]KAB7616080.1 head-tail adaptor protein [Amylibacter sp. SFDW26]
MVHLSKRLTLEERVETADGAGGFVESWRVVGDLWAHIDARSGRVRNGDAVSVSVVRYRIVVRSAPVGSEQRPRADQRFRYGRQAYVIDAVAPHDEAGLYLECWAHVEVAA